MRVIALALALAHRLLPDSPALGEDDDEAFGVRAAPAAAAASLRGVSFADLAEQVRAQPDHFAAMRALREQGLLKQLLTGQRATPASARPRQRRGQELRKPRKSHSDTDTVARMAKPPERRSPGKSQSDTDAGKQDAGKAGKPEPGPVVPPEPPRLPLRVHGTVTQASAERVHLEVEGPFRGSPSGEIVLIPTKDGQQVTVEASSKLSVVLRPVGFTRGTLAKDIFGVKAVVSEPGFEATECRLDLAERAKYSEGEDVRIDLSKISSTISNRTIAVAEVQQVGQEVRGGGARGQVGLPTGHILYKVKFKDGCYVDQQATLSQHHIEMADVWTVELDKLEDTAAPGGLTADPRSACDTEADVAAMLASDARGAARKLVKALVKFTKEQVKKDWRLQTYYGRAKPWSNNRGPIRLRLYGLGVPAESFESFLKGWFILHNSAKAPRIEQKGLHTHWHWLIGGFKVRLDGPTIEIEREDQGLYLATFEAAPAELATALEALQLETRGVTEAWLEQHQAAFEAAGTYVPQPGDTVEKLARPATVAEEAPRATALYCTFRRPSWRGFRRTLRLRAGAAEQAAAFARALAEIQGLQRSLAEFESTYGYTVAGALRAGGDSEAERLERGNWVARTLATETGVPNYAAADQLVPGWSAW